MTERNLERSWVPSYPLIRPRECSSGPPTHPINWENSDECGLSRLMRDIRASEGFGGAPGWTKRSFTAGELERYGFRIIEKPLEVPQAVCLACGLEMSLRKEQS